MKGFLNLILPGNPSDNCNRRGLKEGRRAFGFSFGQPAVLADNGVELGLNAPLPSDVDTHSTTPVNLTKRLNYCTHTAAAQVVFLPPVAGQLRDVWVIKNGANQATVTINAADSGNIILSGAVANTNSAVATTTTARFLSNGTNWFRVG